MALGVLATLIGALQLARAVEGTELSDRILEAGKEAARTLARPSPEDKPFRADAGGRRYAAFARPDSP